MVQLEPSEEIEVRLADVARNQGVTVDDYVREHLGPVLLQPSSELTSERRQKAIDSLMTFAKDRGIRLPGGTTVEALILEGRM